MPLPIDNNIDKWSPIYYVRVTEGRAVVDDAGQGTLLTTGQAAMLAGVSRQAVLQAVTEGRLKPARRKSNGRYLFSRDALVTWAQTIERGPARRRRKSAAGRDRSGTTAARIAGRRSPGPPSGGSLGNLPSAVADRFAAAVDPVLLASFRAVLVAGVENQKLAAEVEQERLELERAKIEAQMRAVERKRAQDERANNERQILDRFGNELQRCPGWTPSLVTSATRAAAAVIQAVSDDAAAALATDGAPLLKAFNGAWSAVPRGKSTVNAVLEDLKSREQLIQSWIRALRQTLVAASSAKVPGPPAASGAPNGKPDA